MKKLSLFLLLAFFAGVTQIFAKQYCGEVITATNGKTAVLTCTNPSTGKYVMEITSTEANFNGLMGANVWCHINGNGATYHMTEGYSFKDGKVTFTIPSSVAPDMYTPIYLNIGGGECTFTTIQNQKFDWPASCGGAELTDPELTITAPATNPFELALNATQQIAWTSSNTATPSFTSSNSTAVEVSNAGLITAKAVGSATITVEQAATDTYKKATKTITVTVPGDKSKNTECKGWDNEKSQEKDFVLGYNYEFKTENGDVIVKFEFFDEDINGAYLWDYTTGGFSEKSVTYNNRVVTYTYSQPTTETVTFAVKVTYPVSMSVTKQFTYTVGEDCQPHPVTGVSITSTFTEIEVGQSKTMTAAITPANATNKNVTWSITSGSDYASINSAGTVTGEVAGGSVTVQVETEEGEFTDTKTINIVAAKPTAPSALPAAPTYPANQVKAVYSATYNADCDFGDWGSGTTYTQDTYGKKYITTDKGYFGICFEGAKALNCSQMEYLHADVWVKDDKSIRFVPVHTNCDDQKGVVKDLTGNQWNSIDIPISDFQNGDDWSNVYQIKIDQAPYLTLWFNNVYFYTTQEKTTCALSASVKNNEGGTASVDNAEVTKGGSATFTAEAACGYSFVGWWNNTTKVSENTTYTPTNIQEDLSLVAEFAFVGPSEAATVKTYDQMISIYGIGTPITGVTMNPYWEDATQKTEISVAGKQMWKYSTINYFGIDFDGNRQDVSAMKYIHLDIWPNASGEINFSLIWNGGESPVTIQLVGGQWNSINIPLTNWSTENLKTIRQLKFNAKKTEIGDNGIEGATILVQDIFFYAPNEFTLSEEGDNAENLTAFNGKVCSVTIGRTFFADGYNYTLCLPFDLSEDQMQEAFGADYKLWKLDDAYMKSAEVLYLDFKEVRNLEAGKPYIFCPKEGDEAIENPIIAGVTINAAAPVAQGNNFATMTGIYSPTIVDASNYVLGSDNWLYQSAGDTMLGLRCYFTFGSGVSQNVRARAIFNRSDVVTDLEPIDGAQCTMHDGKYIIDGRFVILRNNARYNAVGEPLNR